MRHREIKYKVGSVGRWKGSVRGLGKEKNTLKIYCMKTFKDKTHYLLLEYFINVSDEGMFLWVRERRKKYLK